MAVLLTACGSVAPAPRDRPPEPGGAAESVGSGTVARLPYGDSPLTELAREMTALALAALGGRPLPSVRLPLAGRGEDGLVAGASEGPREPLRAEAFLARLDVEVRSREAPEAARWIKLGVLVDDSGMHAVQIEPRDVGRVRVSFPAAADAARLVFASTLRGEGPPDPPPVVSRWFVPTSAVEPSDLAHLDVVRAGVDDVAVLVRAGSMPWLLEMRLERGPVIQSSPLVRVVPLPPNT